MTMAMAVSATTPLVQAHDDDDEDGAELAPQLDSNGEFVSFLTSTLPDRNGDEIVVARPADPQSEDTEEEVRPRKERRIKGRRRAVNPLPHVESALRRQQELKTNFRNLARPLKLILREMARRATEDLENNDTAHEQVYEAELVQEQLQSQLEKRTAQIKDADQLQAAYLQQTYTSEADLKREHCKRSIELAQEHILGAMEQEVIRIHRDLSNDHDRVSQDAVTEYHPSPRTPDLDEHDRRYTSHQRHVVETAPAISALDGRAQLRDLLQTQGLLEDENFTVMDSVYRDYAIARKSLTQAVDVLLLAGLQLERDAREHNIKLLVDPKNAPHALVTLADAATGKIPGRKRGDTKSRTAKMLPPSTPGGRPGSRKSHTEDDGSSLSHKHSRQYTDPAPPTKRSRNMSNSKVDATQFIMTGNDHSNQSPLPLIKDERRSISPFEHVSGGGVRMRTKSLPAKSVLSGEAIHDIGQDPRQNIHPHHNQDMSRPHTISSAGYHPSNHFYNQPNDHYRLPPSHRPDMPFSMDRPYSSHHHHHHHPPPPPTLASPFFHRPSMSSGPLHYPPQQQQTERPDFDSFRSSPMDIHRLHDKHPPMPPTAPPVNHFANNNPHRVGLPSLLPPLQHTQHSSPTMPSPLVALPQPRHPQSQMPYSFLPPHSLPPYHAQPSHAPPPMPQHFLPHGSMPPPQPLPPGMQQGPPRPPHSSAQSSQYGGPALAPAAGLSRSAQPVFAQQLDRQEQNRRRNTEGAFPRFRPYYGPNQS